MSEIAIHKTKEVPGSKSLQVTVPADLVRETEDRIVKHYGRNVRLPGFRPGKAPEAVVRKRFHDAIRQSVLEEAIRESWETAKTAENLKPTAEPHIHNLKFEDGGPIEFEFHVEVKPEIKLGRTGGFRLKRQMPKVEDKDVEDRLNDLREQKAAWLPVTGERPHAGQMVRVEVTTQEDGVTGAPQPYAMVLGQGRALPDLEEKIMTLLPGETAEADVRFPEDHPDAAKRGQTRRVRVTLQEVKRQELPPLDDDFAREVGDFENLDGLRAAIREDLTKEAGREADRSVRADLVNQLVEANTVDAPDSMVERLIRGYTRAYEVPEENLEKFRAEFRPVAEGQVKRDLVLDAVAEAEGLRATEKELDARIAELAAARQIPPEQLYASLQKSHRLAELEHSLTEEKVFAHLLQQSTVDEVTA